MLFSRKFMEFLKKSIFKIQEIYLFKEFVRFIIKVNKIKLATLVKGDPKPPLSIAIILRCRGGRYSLPWIAPIYP